VSVTERYRVIQDRIEAACQRAGRDPASVRLLGACKRQPLDRIREAYAAGLRLVGENRLQESAAHHEELADLTGLEWHFIGSIQSRKCHEIAAQFSMVHSVDREKVARKLDAGAAEGSKVLPVLVEVNVGHEETKSGCEPADAATLVELCRELPNLEPRGLMSLPPHTEDPEGSRSFHRTLRELRDAIRSSTCLPLEELSMGMSHDFEVAIEEGSTIVRIGTDLFGPRPD
jgi:pyridoxal phosphate enzyme (YggS family)